MLGLDKARSAPPRWGATLRVPRPHWWLVGVLLVMVVFLFTPKSPENDCIHNITFYGAAEIPHNCDSVSMVNELADVSGYITEPNVWKGRPAYMLSGYVLGQVLMPITKPIWTFFLNRKAEAQAYKKSFAKNFHLHVAFILLNFAIVVSVARYAIFLSGVRPSSLTAVALAVCVASTDLVEGFLYVLHTSLFNYVSAVGAAAYVGFGMTAYLRTVRQEVLLGLLVGVGILIYPAIVILLPAYVVGLIYGVLRWGGTTPDITLGTFSAPKHLGAFFAACIALPLLWFVLNTYILGASTYATASAYGQFTWPLDALRDGNVLESVLRHLGGFSQALVKSMGAELALSGIGLGVLLGAFWVWGRERTGLLFKDPVLFALLIAVLGVLGFNFLQGLYAPRMHMAILVLLYIAIARLGYVLQRPQIAAGVLVGIGAFQLVDAVLYYSTQYN